MAQIKVVLPSGNIANVSNNNHDAEGISKIINNRLNIAVKYCQSKGWSTDPTKLSFAQILEIRKQKEWIEAGK